MGNWPLASPEKMMGLKYGIESDLYSLGVIFCKMIYGKFPYDAKNIKYIPGQKALINDIR